MLKLLKESHLRLQKEREKLQHDRDLVLRDKFRQLDRERIARNFFHTNANEENRALKYHRTKACEQNINLYEGTSDKTADSMLRDAKNRQLLWKTAPELQELRQKVLVAGVCREQSLQRAEKAALGELEREERALSAEVARKERAALQKEEREKELREARSKREYHRELDELMRRKREQEDGGVHATEVENELIDEIRRQIEEEDLRVARAKMEKQNEMRRHMLEEQKMRREMRLQEELRELSESQKVDEYREARELRGQEQDERRRLESELRLQVQEELLELLDCDCREKLRLDELRTELAAEEKEVEEEAKSRQEKMKRRRLRDDLQRVLDMQIKVKKQIEEMEKKEDELYRERMMKELYERDKLQQMGDQKRRQKLIQHKHQVEALLEENRLRRAAEKVKEMEDYGRQMAEKTKHAQMIEEEKARFLRENASDLLGYLPKGLIKNVDSLENLGEEFKKFYSPSCH